MLIISISGIRGTVGGKPGENLTPADIMKFTVAYGIWLKRQKTEDRRQTSKPRTKIVIGRDARISGEMVSGIVCSALTALGMDVVDLGLSTTPTVAIAVSEEKANGGIVITASHNPRQWNALKLLNEKGEFISAKDGKEIMKIAEQEIPVYAETECLGKIIYRNDYLKKHIEKILQLKLVDAEVIRKKKFRVAVDGINSTGGIAVPMLLDALGAEKVFKVHCEPHGNFAHHPEPLPGHLHDLSETVRKNKCHLGIAVDPDVDRLALVCENGKMFGEEYTLVAVADYVLKRSSPAGGANTVSNLSSTRALKEITEKHGGKYFASAVGEVNVVQKMKEKNALIGGEGNGGVIYPQLHYGRDALAGIALFLSHLARSGKTCSQLRKTYPDYFISKNKVELLPGTNMDALLKKIGTKYSHEKINTDDGLRIDFASGSESRIPNPKSPILNPEYRGWVHLRQSNTEPLIRIYAESDTMKNADALAEKIMKNIYESIF